MAYFSSICKLFIFILALFTVFGTFAVFNLGNVVFGHIFGLILFLQFVNDFGQLGKFLVWFAHWFQAQGRFSPILVIFVTILTSVKLSSCSMHEQFWMIWFWIQLSMHRLLFQVFWLDPWWRLDQDLEGTHSHQMKNPQFLL